MSTQTKQQRQSGDVGVSPADQPAQVAPESATLESESTSESATRQEPNDTNNNNNNNNNKHEKQIIETGSARNTTHKRCEQKLTRGKPHGDVDDDDDDDDDESTLRNLAPTKSSKTRITTGGVVVGQSEESSAVRMGSVISGDAGQDRDQDGQSEQSSSASTTSPLRVADAGSLAMQSAEMATDKRTAAVGDNDGRRPSPDERPRAGGELADERTLHASDDSKRDNKHDEDGQQNSPACHSEKVSQAQNEPTTAHSAKTLSGDCEEGELERDNLKQATPVDNGDKLERTILSTNNGQKSSSLRSNKIKQISNTNKWAPNKLTTNNCHFNSTNHLDEDETKELADQLESGSAQFHANAFNHHNPSTAAYFKPASPKRLSYIQSLLLRKWPCLALTICIMTSLLFGILLSGLTIYLMHGVDVGNCSELAARLAHSTSGGGGGGGAVGSQHHLRHQAHHATAAASLLPHELVLASGSPQAAGESETVASDSLAAAEPQLELSHRQLTPSSATSRPQAFQRLPNSVVPQHYELFIWPHIAEPSFHFNGTVEIHLTCRTPTDNITLHALDLVIDESSLELTKRPTSSETTNGTTRLTAAVATSSAPKVTRLSQDKQLQYSIVHLDSQLEAGQDYLLRMDFVGTLNDDLAGFYKIKYERQNSNETTWIAATQFQATDARRAFPCFDEPLYKATFGIRLKHWKNMTALSNMQIVNSEESPDGLWITDTFAKSQRMSTYLVAFAMTNFESRTNGNITVWTRPGLVHTAEYALSIAGKILRHYEDFFGIAYPLPKMDMIALPDFNAGAMENWGLITYRETAMLYDENSSSVANKQRVAVVVAHELAHQWFGNLVTPKWWDDLWLNEGFASFVEYIGVDHVEPKWRMLDQFVVDEIQDVLKLDGLSSSHQISIPVNNPDEISEIFDHISYSKGASIIRMMNHFLTDQVFKAGLQRYLKALKYDNAEQNDLWAHLTAAQQMLHQNSSNSNNVSRQQQQKQPEAIDVSRVMNSWTLQTGYPLVTLTRDYAKNTAQLDQVRYQPFKLQESNITNQTMASIETKQRWEIPITYTWKSEQNWQPVTRLWMHQNQTGPVELLAPQLPRSASEWMILNVQQVGYYRVNYDLRNWKLLIDQLKENHTKISATNRAQLLDDIFELAKSSQIDYQLAMEATKYLKLESEYLPWESVLLSFGYIDEMLLRTSIYGDWQDYFAQLIAPYYERYRDLEWVKSTSNNTSVKTVDNSTSASRTVMEIGENDVLEHYNHVNAVSWACAVNNQHCIDKAVAVFREWRKSGVNNIKPALRHRAYCTAIEFGTKDDWDFLWRVYEKEQGASEKDRILRALGCSRELWILSRYLEWTFSKSKPIRRQDGAFVFRVVAKNNHGRDIAFNFMRERWSIIKEYYGKSSFSLGGLIKSVATSMNTQLELDQLRTFYESIKGDVGTGKRSFQIAIEEVESNVSWRNRNYKKLEDWLENQKQTPK